MKLYDLHSIPFEFELGGVQSIATFAALESFDDSAVANGGIVFVETFRDYFQKVTGTVPVSDDATQAPTFSGDGGWYRLVLSSPTWRTQATWYIANTTGSDEAVGGALAPLKTFAEFQRRLPKLTQDTTVVFSEDTTETLTGDFSTLSGADAILLTIQGAPDVVVTNGEITAIAAPNPDSGTNLAGTLEADDDLAAPIDWNATTFDGRCFVEVITDANNNLGFAVPVIAATGLGNVTAYTPFWFRDTAAGTPAVGDRIRVITPRSAPSMKIDVVGIVVKVKYLYFTDSLTYTKVSAAPFYYDGASIVATQFQQCRFDCFYEANATWNTVLQSCLLDADNGTFGVVGGSGSLRALGCGVMGDLTHSSGVALEFNGAIIMIGSLTVSGTSTDSNDIRPQLLIGTSGLGIFGIALSTTGLKVFGGDVRVNGPLFGKTHLVGASVSLGGAVSVKSTLAANTELSLTGTTQLSLSTPNGIGAGLCVPVVAGIPTGAGAAMATWANWATLNRQAINFGDLSRIVGLA